MMSPHDPENIPTDPHPVRPGTSAALTAKTIDATVYPPIVKAQEAVAELIPRIAPTLSSPLFATTLAGTLVFVWLAMRARTRLAPVLLSAMLMLTLTSFRPVGIPDEVRDPDETQVVDDDDDDDDEDGERPDRVERRRVPPPVPEPPSFEIQIPEASGENPEIEEIMEDEELREAIEDLRERIEEELRRREGRSHDEDRFLTAQLLA